ncbi:MAG TPA: hypothetical protein K8U92_06985 [Aliarcobacter thereius]|jgi:hypothetical protein|nr:hypothetical protein [Aliarcobacter thereius]HJE03608.1 hypothetical protein [Aliarcobacter thereius]
MRTTNFELYEIANDFRFYFISLLSAKAIKNSWKSSMKMETNQLQNAFYFSQQVKYDTGRVMEEVYKDIQDVLRALRGKGFEFDAETIKKGYSFEVTNIKWKD